MREGKKTSCSLMKAELRLVEVSARCGAKSPERTKEKLDRSEDAQIEKRRRGKGGLMSLRKEKPGHWKD